MGGGRLWAPPPVGTRLGPSLLHDAVARGEFRAVADLLDDAVDPDEPDVSGFTPLYLASSMGHAPTVSLLLRAGADPTRSDSGTSPLHAACLFGHTAAASLLLRFGALPDQVDLRGDSPLGLAARFGHLSTCRLLLHAGADPCHCGATGQSLLAAACAQGDALVVQMLLRAGANPNAKDPDGKTPLFFCAGEMGPTVANLLLQHGASVLVVGADGLSPHQHAEACGQAHVAVLLQRQLERHRAAGCSSSEAEDAAALASSPWERRFGLLSWFAAVARPRTWAARREEA